MADKTALEGYLVATKPPEGIGGGTEPEGDGPPSSDDEGGDQPGEMASWSKFGGDREGSFRKPSEGKADRAREIRSNCLTSHLVTPAQRARKLDTSFKMPAAPSTIAIQPRSLGDRRSSGEGSGSFTLQAKDKDKRRKSLDNLSALAVGKAVGK